MADLSWAIFTLLEFEIDPEMLSAGLGDMQGGVTLAMFQGSWGERSRDQRP